MKLQDLKNMDKDELLGLLGLETTRSDSGRLLGALGIFGLGAVVGAGVALLLAPKRGSELREDLRTRLHRNGSAAVATDGEAEDSAAVPSRRA
jgi:hypothetical protein